MDHFTEIARLDAIFRTTDDEKAVASVAQRIQAKRALAHREIASTDVPKLNPAMAGSCHYDNRSV